MGLVGLMPLGALHPSKSGLMNKHIVKHIVLGSVNVKCSEVKADIIRSFVFESKKYPSLGTNAEQAVHCFGLVVTKFKCESMNRLANRRFVRLVMSQQNQDIWNFSLEIQSRHGCLAGTGTGTGTG